MQLKRTRQHIIKIHWVGSVASFLPATHQKFKVNMVVLFSDVQGVFTERLEYSLMTIYVMTMGELNYHDEFVPWERLPFSTLTNILFIVLVLAMPIILMNMLVSLTLKIFQSYNYVSSWFVRILSKAYISLKVRECEWKSLKPILIFFVLSGIGCFRILTNFILFYFKTEYD